MENRGPASLIQLPMAGTPSYEVQMRKDHVVTSLEMMVIIRQELAKESELSQLAANLKANIGSISS